ncbi:hypothetical protein GFL51_33250 [Rhizobium leguminosarum bv. viciae]|nr:hypothetical protein [Rhizobium leguminosarum bv. viciae]
MWTNLALPSASSSALCRGSAAYRPAVDARDKPEHDEREVGRLLATLCVEVAASRIRHVFPNCRSYDVASNAKMQ